MDIAIIALAGATLYWDPSNTLAFGASALLVSAACRGWAIDDDLTRMVSCGDPVQVAALKDVGA